MFQFKARCLFAGFFAFFWLCSTAMSAVLYKTDFEGDTLGAVPKGWVHVLGPEADAEIQKDPQDANNKVFATLAPPSATNQKYAVEALGDLTDLVAEWDWLFTVDTYNNMGFRYQENAHYYQLSRRPGGGEVNMYAQDSGWQDLSVGNAYVTVLDKWYRAQLILKGDTFTFKIKEKSDDTPFEKIDPLTTAEDGRYKEGLFLTDRADHIDNVIIAETVEDILAAAAVNPSSKLTLTWGALKTAP